MTSSILVTGWGFIGFNLTNQLLEKKLELLGLIILAATLRRK